MFALVKQTATLNIATLYSGTVVPVRVAVTVIVSSGFQLAKGCLQSHSRMTLRLLRKGVLRKDNCSSLGAIRLSTIAVIHYKYGVVEDSFLTGW